MLQYITSTTSKTSVTDQIKSVINGGCRWVQIRMKEASNEEVSNVVKEVKQLCADTGTILILDDRVELAKELELDGVHLGKNDMLPTQAREILGASPIIGVTVNSIDDIKQIRYFDVDYIGMGPFRFTETKKNLSPIVGLSGYKEAMDFIHSEKIELPVVAIGGITINDIDDLINVGVNGIAVCGAIAEADDISVQTKKYLKLLNKPNKIG